MCGIAGLIGPQPISERQQATLMAVNGRMHHRGPDSGGLYQDQRVALAMRRLKIIDLLTGDQPLFNEDKNLVVVANGEVYNHKELRRDLLARGHQFGTSSDIETMLHLYEEMGEDFLSEVQGMFAMALWDRREGRFLLARDRLGEKPLHLHRDATGALWFASELDSLLPALGGRFSMDPTAVYQYLVHQYVPEPRTMLQGVTLLPAGHLLSLTPEDIGRPSRAYWTFLGQEPSQNDDPAGEVRHIFSESCRLMGTADVPVAISLSGGIDSSAVAVFTARHYPGQIGAFTVGYPGKVETDERSIARKLAQDNGLPLTEVMVAVDEVVREFPLTVQAMGGSPIADIAAHGYYAVARAARREGYPVLMSGIGGDEQFWGYPWVAELAAQVMGDRAPTANPAWRSGLKRLRDRLRGVPAPPPDGAGGMPPALYSHIASFRQEAAWAGEALAGSFPEEAWLEPSRLSASGHRDLEVLRALDSTWLVSNCLALADRMAMAHSVEPRLPLLDVRLTERLIALRLGGMRDWSRGHKALLLEAIGRDLPQEVVNHPKQGFTPPTLDWYQSVIKAYSPLLDDGVLLARGVLSPSGLASVLAKATPLFRYKLILLEVWARQSLEGQEPAELSRTPLAAEAV